MGSSKRRCSSILKRGTVNVLYTLDFIRCMRNSILPSHEGLGLSGHHDITCDRVKIVDVVALSIRRTKHRNLQDSSPRPGTRHQQ